VYTVRASPAFHRKMASMPLLDGAMQKNGVKVGVYAPNLCSIQGFSGLFRRHGKAKKTAAC
jgi:hypothetical protein